MKAAELIKEYLVHSQLSSQQTALKQTQNDP
jgi:hypothetical protein